MKNVSAQLTKAIDRCLDQSSEEFDPYFRLWKAIIFQAARDLFSRPYRGSAGTATAPTLCEKREAEDFFRSKYFEDMATTMGGNPDYIRRLIADALAYGRAA